MRPWEERTGRLVCKGLEACPALAEAQEDQAHLTGGRGVVLVCRVMPILTFRDGDLEPVSHQDLTLKILESL